MATLAVLKAGGAFVLLEPSQPDARLSAIIQQTNGSVLVSSSKQGPSNLTLFDNVIVINSEYFADNVWQVDRMQPNVCPSVAHVYCLYIRQHRDAKRGDGVALSIRLGNPLPT